MENTILLGRRQEIKRISSKSWTNYQLNAPERAKNVGPQLEAKHIRLHHALLKWVIRESKAFDPDSSPGFIGVNNSEMPDMIGQLEKRLVLIARNSDNYLSWIHPTTIEETPHCIELDDGQTFYASCASAVLEAPYILGKVFDRPLTARVWTECDHCGETIEFEIDSDQNVNATTQDAEVLVFDPRVTINLETFPEPDIVDAY